MFKKSHSKNFYGSLAILRSLSTCKVAEMHPLRMMECCISFFWECILVNLGSSIPLDFSRYRENRLTFLNGVFCNLIQILMMKYDPAGVTRPWTWVPWEANEFMVRFFWDWVYCVILVPGERCVLASYYTNHGGPGSDKVVNLFSYGCVSEKPVICETSGTSFCCLWLRLRKPHRLTFFPKSMVQFSNTVVHFQKH